MGYLLFTHKSLFIGSLKAPGGVKLYHSNKMFKAKTVGCSSFAMYQNWHCVLSEYCSECQCESCPRETEISYRALQDQIMLGSSWVFVPFNWNFICWLDDQCC